MSYEEEFDKIIRQKAESADFPFDEKGWVQASHMLDAQRAAGRKALLSKWAAPALITVVVGTGLFFAGKQFIGSDETTNKTAIAVPSDNVNSTLNETPGTVYTEQTQLSQNNGAETNVPENVSALPEQKSVDKVNNQESGTVQKIKAAVKPANEAVPAKTDAPVRSVPVNAAVAVNANEKSVEAKSTADIELVEEGSGKEEKNEISKTSVAPKQVLNIGKSSNSNISGNVTAIQPVTDMNPEKQTGSAEMTSAVLPVIDFLNPRMARLEVLPPKDLQPSFVLLKRYEDDYYKPRSSSKYLGVEFGGTYLMGWNSTNGKDGSGLNWFAGINAATGLSEKTSMSAGLQLYNITNIRNPYHNSEIKSYGFGYSSSFTSVTTDNLYYLALPLKFNYHLNRNGFVGLGLNTGYLVKAHSRVDTYKEADGVKSTAEMAGNNKIFDGTSSLNLMGSVSYNTHLNSRTVLSLEFIYGFTDLFENNATIKNAERPMGIRIGMNYQLFKN